MTRQPLHSLLGVLALGLVGPACFAEERPPSAKTPLDDYVAKADATYSWKVVQTIPGAGYTTFIVDMNSQTWRAVPEVDRPVWQHWLVVVKPETVAHDTALLMIGGGKNDGMPPTRPS